MPKTQLKPSQRWQNYGRQINEIPSQTYCRTGQTYLRRDEYSPDKNLSHNELATAGSRLIRS
jgi:hypothetical protein